jgi:hypothetical protein
MRQVKAMSLDSGQSLRDTPAAAGDTSATASSGRRSSSRRRHLRKKSTSNALHNEMLAESLKANREPDSSFAGSSTRETNGFSSKNDDVVGAMDVIGKSLSFATKRRHSDLHIKGSLKPSFQRKRRSSVKDKFTRAKHKINTVRRLASARAPGGGLPRVGSVGGGLTASRSTDENDIFAEQQGHAKSFSQELKNVKDFEQQLLYLTALANDRPEDEDQTPRLCAAHLKDITHKFSRGKVTYKDQLKVQTKTTCQDHVRALLYKNVDCCACYKNCCHELLDEDQADEKGHERLTGFFTRRLHRSGVSASDETHGSAESHACLHCLSCCRHCQVRSCLDHGSGSEDDGAFKTPGLSNTMQFVPFDVFIFCLILINSALIVWEQFITGNFESANVTTTSLLNVSSLNATFDDAGAAPGTYVATLHVLRIIEISFLIIFTIESLLRMYALHIKRFCLNAWNLLDVFVVIMGWSAILVQGGTGQIVDGASGANTLRLLRMVRIVRSLRLFQGILMILEVMRREGRLLITLSWLFLFMVLLVASVGMQLFGPALQRRCVLAHGNNFTFTFDRNATHNTGGVSILGIMDNPPRWCSNSCDVVASSVTPGAWAQCQGPSVMSTLSAYGHSCAPLMTDDMSRDKDALFSVCAIVDDRALRPYVRAVMAQRQATADNVRMGQKYDQSPMPGGLEFLSFGNFLPAFMSILYIISGDAVTLLRDRLADASSLSFAALFTIVCTFFVGIPFSLSLQGLVCAGLNRSRDAFFRWQKIELTYAKEDPNGEADEALHMFDPDGTAGDKPTAETRGHDKGTEGTGEKNSEPEDGMDAKEPSWSSSRHKTTPLAEAQNNTKECTPCRGASAHTRRLVESWWFEVSILLLIVANTITLIIEMNPRFDATGAVATMFVWAEVCFSVVFMTEMILKMIAWGVWRFFAKAKFNVLDFIIVVSTSTLSVMQAVTVFDVRARRAYLNAGQAASAARVLRLFKISRASRITKAVQFLGSLKRLTSLVADSVLSVILIHMLILVSGSIFAITLASRSTGDQRFCDPGMVGVSSDMSFETIPKALLTLLMAIGWDHVWHTFDGCIKNDKMGDSIIYLLWLATVAAFTNKLIAAVVVANFEATDRERKNFLSQRLMYLHLIHKEELRFMRARGLAGLTSGRAASQIQRRYHKDTRSRARETEWGKSSLAEISSCIISLKVAVLSPKNGFPSRELRRLRMIVIENIAEERLDSLALAFGDSLRESEALRTKFDEMEEMMAQITMWCKIRPPNQMSFTIRILRVLSVLLVAEASAPVYNMPRDREHLISTTDRALTSISQIHV